jgi:hypothetical protein
MENSNLIDGQGQCVLCVWAIEAGRVDAPYNERTILWNTHLWKGGVQHLSSIISKMDYVYFFFGRGYTSSLEIWNLGRGIA